MLHSNAKSVNNVPVDIKQAETNYKIIVIFALC